MSRQWLPSTWCTGRVGGWGEWGGVERVWKGGAADGGKVGQPPRKGTRPALFPPPARPTHPSHQAVQDGGHGLEVGRVLGRVLAVAVCDVAERQHRRQLARTRQPGKLRHRRLQLGGNFSEALRPTLDVGVCLVGKLRVGDDADAEEGGGRGARRERGTCVSATCDPMVCLSARRGPPPRLDPYFAAGTSLSSTSTPFSWSRCASYSYEPKRGVLPCRFSCC